jgi:hypothetical protein
MIAADAKTHGFANGLERLRRFFQLEGFRASRLAPRRIKNTKLASAMIISINAMALGFFAQEQKAKSQRMRKQRTFSKP